MDTRPTGAGTVWYTRPVSNDSICLEKAKEDVCKAFMDCRCDTFSPKYIVIATWDHVGYFREQTNKVIFFYCILVVSHFILIPQLNTFQCVIATDGNQSYAIFLYNETEWTTPDDGDLNSTAKVGFNDGTTL